MSTNSSSTKENVFRSGAAAGNTIAIDPSLTSAVAGKCDLLVVADEDCIQFGLIEKKTLSLLAVEIVKVDQGQSNAVNLVSSIGSSELLSKFKYSSVRIACVNSHYTFVPDALFNNGDEHRFFRLNFANDITSLVFSRHHSKYRFHTIYGLSPEFHEAVTTKFTDPVLIPFSEVLLNTRFSSTRNDSGKQLQINVRGLGVDIVLTDGKKLLLMNSFLWQTVEDILYYALFVCEQLEVNPEQVQAELTGDVDRPSAIYKLLEKYFSTLKFSGLVPGVKLGYGIDQLGVHRYPVLLGLGLCE